MIGARLLSHLKKKMAAGLILVVPVGLTIFILRFLFGLADGVLAPVIRSIADLIGEEGHYVPGLGMIAGALVIYFTGVLATNVFGSQLVSYGDSLLSRIPLVKSIYVSTKQLLNVLSKSNMRENFRRAVYVEFPMEGSYSLGFTSNMVSTESGKIYYTVFVPTSPNPTSGYVLLLEESRIYPTSYGVEEAMKLVMSGGMVAPEVIRAPKLQ